MKTTLDIPRDTLDEAMRLTGAKTKREAVLKALEEMNRRARMANLAERLGTSDTFMSPEELTALRAREIPGT